MANFAVRRSSLSAAGASGGGTADETSAAAGGLAAAGGGLPGLGAGVAPLRPPLRLPPAAKASLTTTERGEACGGKRSSTAQ